MLSLAEIIQDFFDFTFFGQGAEGGNLFSFNFCKCLFIFERQRETGHKRGEEQRERETQNPKQAPASELSAQSPTRGSNS